MNLSAVLLAGGQSRRMGQDKAWLSVNGVPLIRRGVATLREIGVEEVFISGRPGADYASLGCPVLLDLKPGFGPLGGIERGLQAARSPLLIVLAVDLPHVTCGFLRRLLARCDARTGVVPHSRGAWEPLVAVYPTRCHALAADFVATSRHAVQDFAAVCHREQAVHCLEVTPEDAGCLANWNCPTDVSHVKGPG